MTPDETELVIQLINNLCERLTGDDLTRLDQCVARTRHTRLRTLYQATMNNADSPVERLTGKIQMRQWLRQNTVEQQVFHSLERISEGLDLLITQNKGEQLTTNHDSAVAKMILTDVLAEIELLTGIDDLGDPITVVCCAVVMESYGLPVDDLAQQLADIGREYNQRVLNDSIIHAITNNPNAEQSELADTVTRTLVANEQPIPGAEHLAWSIDNVLVQMRMADDYRAQRVAQG